MAGFSACSVCPSVPLKLADNNLVLFSARVSSPFHTQMIDLDQISHLHNGIIPGQARAAGFVFVVVFTWP